MSPNEPRLQKYFDRKPLVKILEMCLRKLHVGITPPFFVKIRELLKNLTPPPLTPQPKKIIL